MAKAHAGSLQETENKVLCDPFPEATPYTIVARHAAAYRPGIPKPLLKAVLSGGSARLAGWSWITKGASVARLACFKFRFLKRPLYLSFGTRPGAVGGSRQKQSFTLGVDRNVAVLSSETYAAAPGLGSNTAAYPRQTTYWMELFDFHAPVRIFCCTKRSILLRSDSYDSSNSAIFRAQLSQ